MYSKYISFESGHCNTYQSEIDLYSRFLNTNILTNIPTYGEIFEEEIRFISELTHTNNVSIHNFETSEIRHKVTENAVFMNDISIYMLGMTIVATYHLWERQIIGHLTSQLKLNSYDVSKIKRWDWDKIIDILEKFSTPKTIFPFHDDLNELRLVANAIKHGKGKSYNDLIKLHTPVATEQAAFPPERLDVIPLLGIRLYPTRELIQKYISAAKMFWDYSHWEKIGPHRHATTTSTSRSKVIQINNKKPLP